MKELMLRENMDYNRSLQDLIEIVHFTEGVSAKIHGLHDELKIYETVSQEFAKSKKYNASIFLLSEDGTKIRIEETSLSQAKVKAALRLLGYKSYKDYYLDLDKSTFFKKVIRDRMTVNVRFPEAIYEFFPRPLARLLIKVIGFERQTGILTPLMKHGQVIGVLVVDSTQLAKHFIPTVKNLATHISNALELADEYSKRKTVEDALKENEEKYRSLVELAPDSIMTFDLKGVITSCNEASTKISGYSKDELVGKHFSKIGILRVADTPRYLKILGSTIRGKIPDNIEVKWMHKNGSVRTGDVRFSLMKKEGKTIGIQAIMRDVTELKLMEDKLAYERDLLYALMDNVPDAIYFKDAKSRFTMINREHARWIEVNDPAEALGKTDFDFYAEEFAREAYEDERKVLKTGQPLIGRIEKILTKDGKPRWASATKVPIKSENGHVIGIVGISRDITELKQMEERLEYERDLLEALMDNVPDLIYFKDASSRFTRINRKHAQWFGLKDPKEAIGKTDFDFYPKELASQFYSDEQTFILQGQPIIAKEELQSRGRWLSTTKVPVKDGEGQVIGIVGISRDITELKRMEEEIKRYTKHLEEIVEERTRKLKEVERLAAIGETTAMIGHDLRNPLQVIVNTVYLANRRLEELPSKLRIIGKLRELIEIIEEQTKYMDKIVSDLQEYALPLQLQSVETGLDKLVADALSATVVPGNIKVQVKIASNCPPLRVDPRLMKRVFANLITNGLQAMHDGGYLTIEASLKDETASVTVRDTGVGMSEETLHHIFRPLFSTKPKGQGLGLAVCKRLVEAHGGNIKVKSEPNKGSTFTVNIPLKTQAQQIKNNPILDHH